MSGDALGYVVRHSPFKGATFTVHLCIADSMTDLHGNRFWMATSTLATKARVSRQTASEAIGELVSGGFLSVVQSPMKPDGKKPTGRPGLYQFEFPDVPLVFETRWALRQGVGSDDTSGVAPSDARVAPDDAGCRDSRRNTEDTKLNKTASASSIQAAIDACEQCDKNGLYIPDVDDRHAPARKCDHRLGAIVGGQPIKESA